MKNVVALLDSMWNWCGSEQEATRYFRINPDNHSGRRLYRLIGDHKLLVTNSCKELCASANHHGKPDPLWVADNLRFLETQGMDLLLVCGKVAKETYAASGYSFPRVLFMDHPAARRWTTAAIESTASRISELLLEEATIRTDIPAQQVLNLAS
jgi:hypothetical protein